MTDELKPCPFCCGKGYVICGSSFEFGFPPYAVECEKYGTVGIVKSSEQEAIGAWNTRARIAFNGKVMLMGDRVYLAGLGYFTREAAS